MPFSEMCAATCHAGSSFADFSTLKIEAIRSSDTSAHTGSTRRHIPEDGILQEKDRLRVYNLWE
jgi:hypothetical protein